MGEETVDVLKRRIAELEAIKTMYEQNGPAKLYYALNRKMWEMADLLNATNLKHLSLEDPKDKTFERLKVLWNDSSSISTAVEALGNAIGITGDEGKDIQKTRKMISPESVAQEVGDYKTHDV